MRILFISYELPPIGGGGGRAALQIASRLVERGHAVCILSSLFPGLAERELIHGVEVNRIRVRRRSADECSPLELLSFMWRSIPAACRLADQFSPQVVCAFFGIPGGPAAWWLRARRGIPYVLSLRGSDVPRPELRGHQPLHLFTRPLLRAIYRRASAIVAVSESLRRAALAVAPKAPIQVIPNGVDTDRLKPPAARPWPAERLELLFVGRLREFKGVQHAIRALSAIARTIGKPVHLTVAGEGPFRPQLEALARGVQDAAEPVSVRFVGKLGEAQLRATYEKAALLLLPSLAEGYPNVILEAMAMGIPCVAADAPGTRDALTDGVEGVLTPPCDPDAIAVAVARIVSNPQTWSAMSRSARARAEGLSWNRIAAEYEQALCTALREAAVS